MYYTQDSAYDSYNYEHIKYCMHIGFALAHLAVVIIIIIILILKRRGRIERHGVCVRACVRACLSGMIFVFRGDVK
jgi:hypothetical protein